MSQSAPLNINCCFEWLCLISVQGTSSTSLNMSDLARGCLNYYRQQRVMTHPVLVHCLEGSGRTAAFLLMAAAMSEIDVAAQGEILIEKNTMTMNV